MRATLNNGTVFFELKGDEWEDADVRAAFERATEATGTDRESEWRLAVIETSAGRIRPFRFDQETYDVTDGVVHI